MTINEAVPLQTGMVKGSSVTGDQIQVPNTSGGYATYFLSDGYFTAKGKTTYDETRDGKWCDPANGNKLATSPLTSGQAFWYYQKGLETPFSINVAGAVAQDVTKSVSVYQDWTLIANPYPTVFLLNDGVPFTTGMIKGSSVTGDQIQVPNGMGGYATYFLSDGYFTAKGKTTYDETRDGKWCDPANGNKLATAGIPIGVGAWYNRKGTETFEIVVPNPTAPKTAE